MIHATAVVHPGARLGAGVRIGPYSVIDEEVELGPECCVGPHVYVTGRTTLGSRNQLFAGCVLGEAPQDLHYTGEPTALEIGDNNVFRENVTIHRSNKPGQPTLIGSDNLFMAGSHVAHNCTLGNRVILANGALLAGHVQVGDRAFLSGNCVVHQFVRVGRLAFMQGGTAVSMDLPPFTTATDTNILCGLNIVGLRRAGISPADRLALSRAYKLLFRSGLNLRSAVAQARVELTAGPVADMLDFVASSVRGVCMHRIRHPRRERDLLTSE